MTKIVRATQKIFAVDAGATGVTEFGSTAAGSTVYSYDLSAIQTTAFQDGWLAGILTGSGTKRLPVYEDMNAIHYVATSQLAYLLQEGISEYDSGTTYYINSIVKKTNTFLLYGSITDNNVGNPLTDAANWKLLIDLENNDTIYTYVKTDNYSLVYDDVGECFVMNSSLPKSFLLPIIGDGYYYYLKNIGSGTVTITPFGTNTTDATTLYTDESIILVADFINSKWRTLAKFNVQATNNISGILKTSTQAQVDAGTDTTTAVTPATLENKPSVSPIPVRMICYQYATDPQNIGGAEYRDYTTPVVYTPTSGTTAIKCIGVGGGGSVSTTTNNAGSGAYFEVYTNDVSPKTITVGLGGSILSDSDGGLSSFGSIATATGGLANGAGGTAIINSGIGIVVQGGVGGSGAYYDTFTGGNPLCMSKGKLLYITSANDVFPGLGNRQSAPPPYSLPGNGCIWIFEYGI